MQCRQFCLASFLLIVATSANGEFSDFTFTKIVDSRDLIPGTNQLFSSSFNGPSLSGDNVVFDTYNSPRGVYAKIDGVLQIIADANTPRPDDSGNFSPSSFDLFPKISGSNVVFTYTGLVFAKIGGTLEKISPRTSLRSQGIEGSTVVFGTTDNGFAGVYAYTNGIENIVANTQTPVPGGIANFASFRRANPEISQGNIVFGASSTTGGSYAIGAGVYLYSGGNLTTVVDTHTTIPGGSGNFHEFGNYYNISGTDVSFLGVDSQNRQGIYLYSAGALHLVADTNTIAPGEDLPFVAFALSSVSGNNVLFQGSVDASKPPGLYASLDGVLTKVVGVGDVVGGITVGIVRFSMSGLSGNQFGFEVDGSWAVGGGAASGIFVASVPEASSFLLAAFGAAVALCKVSCRRRPTASR